MPLPSDIDGVRLLDAESSIALARTRSIGLDEVLGEPSHYGSGVQKPTARLPLLGPASYGHDGHAGSLALADPRFSLGMAFTTNISPPAAGASAAALTLVAAASHCLNAPAATRPDERLRCCPPPRPPRPGPARRCLRSVTAARLAAYVSASVHALDPDYFGLAPVQAIKRALAKAGKGFDDLSVLELNEAFAAQGLDCVAEWPEFDPAILNPQGGAIALGHPLGASGARLAGTIAHQLARRGSGVGVATLCIGVGQGLVLER
jgi:acetyl-CoA acetyltransferase